MVLVTGECQGGRLPGQSTYESWAFFFPMNSLSCLLLPDYLPPCVIVHMSYPSPVFLALFTLNQRVKNNIPWGGPGVGGVAFIIWMTER